MEFQVVPKSFFSQSEQELARLDPEFASPKLVAIERDLRAKLPCNTLRSIGAHYSGPTVNDKLKPQEDIVKYVAIDSIDLDDGLAYSDEMRFVDRPSRAVYILGSGDLLVSTVRPNRGAVSLVTKRLEGALASSGFALCRVASSAYVTPEYLFAYMRTPIARLQLIRRNRGSMYPAVLDSDVFDISVPEPSDAISSRVTKLVKVGMKAQDDFFYLHRKQQASLGEYLSKTVGKPPPDPLSAMEKTSTSIRRHSDFFGDESALRFDAEFFRGEYDEFEGRMRKVVGHFKIGDYYLASTGRTQGNEKSEIAYLRQSILTNAGINWNAIALEPGSDTPEKGRVQSADILLACTAHEIFYIGRKVDYVRAVPPEIASTNVCVPDLMILRPRKSKPDDLDGSYIAAYLRSPWGLHQVQRCIRGLRGGHVYPRDIERFVRVVRPPKKWLREFAADAAKAEERRNLAKAKIADAVEVLAAWFSKSGIKVSKQTAI